MSEPKAIDYLDEPKKIVDEVRKYLNGGLGKQAASYVKQQLNLYLEAQIDLSQDAVLELAEQNIGDGVNASDLCEAIESVGPFAEKNKDKDTED